jgi:hypothetical protein
MSLVGPSGAPVHTSTTVSDSSRRAPGRLLDLYGRLLGPLLAGYLMFDRAFAYLHPPGLPLYIGEIVLGLGTLGVLLATGYLRIPARDEPMLALLALFGIWGAVRAVPGLPTYGLDAVRDSALWYYSLFAFLAVAALARAPQLIDRLLGQLHRIAPWLLLWLPVAVLLTPVAEDAPVVPFTTTSILSHKPGNAAIAAMLILVWILLFPERINARMRGLLGAGGLLVIALSATQNRGGLLGVAVGGTIALLFVRNRVRILTRTAIIGTVVGALAVMLIPSLPFTGEQGRAFSPSQLIENVVSLSGADVDANSNLSGTVDGREELWTRILDKQIRDGELITGSGFGPNLAAAVGVLDEGKETLRNPHNSHLNVLARMGVIGLCLWIVLWLSWYRSVARACRRLAGQGLWVRRQVAVMAMSVTASIHVSSFFDPQLEGPQIAILLWTLFGIGVAVSSSRTWFAGGGDVALTAAGQALGRSRG